MIDHTIAVVFNLCIYAWIILCYCENMHDHIQETWHQVLVTFLQWSGNQAVICTSGCIDLQLYFDDYVQQMNMYTHSDFQGNTQSS